MNKTKQIINETCPKTKWVIVTGNMVNENIVNRIQIIDLCEHRAIRITIKHNEIRFSNIQKLDAHCNGK
jgi:hypothetical protein